MPVPIPNLPVRDAVKELVYAASRVIIRDDDYSAESLTAFAALVHAAAQYNETERRVAHSIRQFRKETADADR